MDKTTAIQCLMILKASYPRADVTQETLTAYATMLKDVDAIDARSAIERLICTSKFFPTIAEIRAEVAAAKTAHLPEPEAAWGEVQRAIGKFGVHRVPEFSCPEIAAAVSDTGWRTICLSENVTTTRAHFRGAYRAILEGERESHQLGERSVRPALGERTGYGRLTLASGDE